MAKKSKRPSKKTTGVKRVMTAQEALRGMADEMGSAEWGHPDHGAAMFHNFIDKWYSIARGLSSPLPSQKGSTSKPRKESR